MKLEIERRGMEIARVAMAYAVCAETREAQRYAEARWGQNSIAAAILKTAVTAGDLGDSAWASPLAQQAGVEFLALVRERSLVGRMDGLRSVPLSARVISQTGGANAAWVGEGQVVPITSAAFAAPTSLSPLKVVAQSVQTDELLRLANSEAEQIIRNDLVAAASEALDASFADPSNAGSTGVSPASIASGAPSVTASKFLKDDLQALVHAFGGDLGRAYFLANPETLILFSGADRPNIGARGGEMIGIPALASRKIPLGSLILADAGGISIGAENAQVTASRNGLVQMETAPDSPVTAATVMVSLWQHDMVSLQATLSANWNASSGAVAVLTGLTNLGDSP